MRKVANRSAKELEALFKETSAKDGRFNEAIVEKDFWVCVMLDHLFRHCRYKDSFTFKGGVTFPSAIIANLGNDGWLEDRRTFLCGDFARLRFRLVGGAPSATS